MPTAKSNGRKTTDDAIALIKKDHRTVDDLFKRYRALGDRAFKSKQDLVERMTRELSTHAAVEEQILYPRLRKSIQRGEKRTDHALDEHQEVKEILARLERMDPSDNQYDPLVEQLTKSVKAHVAEEEKELLPELKTELDREELLRMADLIKAARRNAPTRPHPKAPNTPPANVIAGAVAGVLDRARDAGRKAVRGR
jgi:hemerythrin superfamily protein